MSIYYTTLLFVFAVIVYMMTVDKNVSDAIVLVTKASKLKIERLYWMIRFHPRNPLTNLIMKWKYEKLAQDLHTELTAQDPRATMKSESKTQ